MKFPHHLGKKALSLPQRAITVAVVMKSKCDECRMNIASFGILQDNARLYSFTRTSFGSEIGPYFPNANHFPHCFDIKNSSLETFEKCMKNHQF